jgi:hypothetical protein
MTKTIGSDTSTDRHEQRVTLAYREVINVPLSVFQEWVAAAHFDSDEEAVKFLNNETAITDWFIGSDEGARSSFWQLEVIGHDDNDWRLDITVG